MNKTTSFNTSTLTRRRFFGATAGVAAALAVQGASAQDGSRYSPSAPPTRYPEPDLHKLDDRFTQSLINASIERIYTGLRWGEGPAWNGVGQYLVFSDIINDEQLRYIDEIGQVTRRFRKSSNYSNGNTFDLQGRQISCEHLTRRVVRYEQNGEITVLADSYNGASFNAPNDVVVNPLDESIWFTDPGYGSLGRYEGTTATTGSLHPYQKEAVYRIDAQTGNLTQVTDEIQKPNGLCFSPDYKKLYVSDTGANVYEGGAREIREWTVNGDRLTGGKRFTSLEYNGKQGLADGIRCDTEGNIWAAVGWGGQGYDGVHVYAPDGDRIAAIHLPEVCANICFGGRHRNRLFMVASQSLYAMYVNTQGAHFC